MFGSNDGTNQSIEEIHIQDLPQGIFNNEEISIDYCLLIENVYAPFQEITPLGYFVGRVPHKGVWESHIYCFLNTTSLTKGFSCVTGSTTPVCRIFGSMYSIRICLGSTMETNPLQTKTYPGPMKQIL